MDVDQWRAVAFKVWFFCLVMWLEANSTYDGTSPFGGSPVVTP